MASRCLSFGRSVQRLNTGVFNVIRDSTRQSHAINYRTGPLNHSKATRYGAEIVGGVMWWWVLWHIWHEPEHITGEYYYPDPEEWTNSELGIPSDHA